MDSDGNGAILKEEAKDDGKSAPDVGIKEEIKQDETDSLKAESNPLEALPPDAVVKEEVKEEETDAMEKFDGDMLRVNNLVDGILRRQRSVLRDLRRMDESMGESLSMNKKSIKDIRDARVIVSSLKRMFPAASEDAGGQAEVPGIQSKRMSFDQLNESIERLYYQTVSNLGECRRVRDTLEQCVSFNEGLIKGVKVSSLKRKFPAPSEDAAGQAEVADIEPKKTKYEQI